jgi:Secretion system C-terminal sorting domain
MTTKSLFVALFICIIKFVEAQPFNPTAIDNYIHIKEELLFENELKQDLDSIYYYKGSLNQWYLNYRSKTIAADNNGRPLESTYEYYDANIETWIKKTKLDISYFNNTNIHKLNLFIWDSLDNSWILDRNNTYNENGKIIETYRISGRTAFNTTFIPGYRKLYTYNDEGFILNIVEYMRNYETNSWDKIEETSTSYENQILKKIEKSFLDQDSHDILPMSKFDFVYNENNKLIKKVHSHFNHEEEVWKENRVSTFIYNEDSMIDSIYITFLDTDNNEWFNSLAYSLKKDNSNRIIEQKIYEWDFNNNIWKPFDYELYEYCNSVICTTTKKRWDIIESKFVNAVRFGDEYNDADKIIRHFDQHWNDNSQEWIDDIQYVYSYLNSIWQTLKIHQAWDTEINSWKNISIDSCKYDDYNRLISRNVSRHFYDEDTWNNDYKFDYYFKDIELQNKELQEAIYTIYPNPANNVIYIHKNRISMHEISIIDMNGKIIHHYPLKDEISTVNISYLKSGVYFIKSIRGNSKMLIKN